MSAVVECDRLQTGSEIALLFVKGLVLKKRGVGVNGCEGRFQLVRRHQQVPRPLLKGGSETLVRLLQLCVPLAHQHREMGNQVPYDYPY